MAVGQGGTLQKVSGIECRGAEQDGVKPDAVIDIALNGRVLFRPIKDAFARLNIEPVEGIAIPARPGRQAIGEPLLISQVFG